MKDFLSLLNYEQKQAATTTEGHIRVLAGAGTGKTRALTSRYCYLVKEAGISPRNILCVTFTNRAANEMKWRIRSMLGDMDLGYICTFHAFCTMLLHEDINALNFPKDFIILDKEDWRAIMLRIFSDMHLTLRETTVQQKIDQVLEAKKLNPEAYINYIYKLNNEELKAKWQTPGIDQNTEIFLRYLYEQKKCFGVDFNDLINFATYILENFPDVREKWQERMQYVMVDEFQDVSEKQYRIAQILSAKHKNLFIVGDSDQTIYSWRGSHVKLILEFDKKYPDAKTFVLKQNYRSTPQILAASNELISKNTVRYPKKLVPTRADGNKPLYFHAPDSQKEAEWICRTIKKLVADKDAEGGSAKENASAKKADTHSVHLHDVAILYRAHYLSRSVEEQLIKKNIPYTILSGTEFYGRREIKDTVCYLRMLTAADDMAFYRTINMPSRKIGKQKIALVKGYSEEHNLSAYNALKELVGKESSVFKGTGAQAYIDAVEKVRQLANGGRAKLGDILQAILDESGYEAFLRLEADQDRLDNLAEFKRAVNEEGLDDDATLPGLLSRLALFTDLDAEGNSQKDTVRLLTIHAAKGMEFPYVFVCGLNEGVFPSRKVLTLEDMEEERRIAYVAFTRARNRLFLSDAEGKANDGIFKYPSRFILDCGLKNLELERELDENLLEQTRALVEYDEGRLNQMQNLFSPGDRVVHPVFGAGTVVLANEKASCYTIKFDSLPTERSIQFAAKLEKED